ncbi:MAG TPA: PAS-domain containing protein [Myxococcota bacterium]|nr:PAS-domain containing protein [Myxococcota bacterium]
MRLESSDREETATRGALEEALRGERARARELELRASLLGDALEHMAAGVIVYDASLRLLAWNRRFFDVLGFEATLAAPGVPIERFFRIAAERGEYGTGDVEEQVRARLALAAQAEVDFEHVRPDGTILRIHGTPIPGGGRVRFFTDVTALRRAEEAREREALIFQQMFDAVVVTDLAGQIVDWNPAAEQMFGWTREEALGRPANFLHPEPSPELDAQIARVLARGESYLLELPFRRRDGSRGVSEVVFAPLRSRGGGRSFAALAVCRDVTRRKQVELELAHAQRVEAIGRLTGGIAHDFNNLLTVIVGGAELLAQGDEEPAAAAEIAREILAVARTAASLTQRLLAFSRKQALDPRPIALESLLADLAALLSRTLGETITLELRIAKGLPLLFADAAQLESALVNLAVNARDAMPRGGRLEIAARSVEASRDDAAAGWSLGAGAYVEIAVTDEGIGMAAEVLRHAIDPFFTTKARGKGTGLGLSQVYGFARQSGGDLLIESEPGRGTTVRIRLPVAKQPAIPRPAPSLPATRVGDETILVVEDAAPLRRYVARALRALGYKVLEAANGPSALLVIDSPEPVDLLLTDIVMPGGLLGLELAAEARKRRPGLRILCMTGHADELADGRDASSPPLLAKPFGRDALANAVRRALGEAPAGS